MKILLDTNIVLDYILEREEHFESSEQIFRYLNDAIIDIFVAPITPVNVYYVVRKEKGSAIAKDAVGFLLDAVKCCISDHLVLQNAYDLNFNDYEDAVQCASAIAEGLDAIVTRNTKDYKNSPLPVYSPDEFVELIEPHS